MNASELLREYAEQLGFTAIELRRTDPTLDPVGLILDGGDADARDAMRQIAGITAEAIDAQRVVQTVVRRTVALAILRDLSPDAAAALDTRSDHDTIPMVAVGIDGVAVGRIEWGEPPPERGLN